MVLKQQVLDAFALLGIEPDTDQATATKAYKRQALLHHPDRNHGDPEATQRFQEIGAAWNICQRHFDNPSWSHVQEDGSSRQTRSGFTYTFNKDDDIPLDEDELYEFYMYMFAETLFGRYSRTKGQRYRYERSGRAGAGLSTFSGGFAESQERQSHNAERQRKENEEYEKRKRELELEIEQEERDRQASEKRRKADDDRRATALEHAFQAAYTGNSAAVHKPILDYDLDVNAPRKRAKLSKRQNDPLAGDSLLHVAASYCDETLVMFLIERGAKPTALNKSHLTPFHAAIKAGNTRVVQFIMERRGRSFDGYHPSKAAPSGCTPLQLAIQSGVPSVVELLVKDATTHDVEKCWKQEPMSEEIKEILRKKKGFVPPDTISLDHPISRKSQLQQELAQKKEARIAEELERAAINRQKREERAAKRAEKDRELATKLAQEEARLRAELEERHRLEDARKAEQVRAKAILDARLKVEAEARAQTARERNLREEAQARLKVETEARAQTARETKLREEAQARLERERSLHPLEESRKRVDESSQSSTSAGATPPPGSPPTDMRTIAPTNVLSPEQRKKLRYAKLKEKRKAKLAEQRLQQKSSSTVTTDQSLRLIGDDKSTAFKGTKKPKTEVAVQDIGNMDEDQRAKHEAALRRRAEQSARDKERHRRVLDERARANSGAQGPARAAEYVPLTPVSTHASRSDSPGRAMVGKIQGPSLQKKGSTQPLPALRVDFAMPVEDIQTCVLPDDLFKDERPVPRPTNGLVVSQPEHPQINSTEVRGTDRPPRRWHRYPHRGRPFASAQPSGTNA
ncbi:hypothetical protein GALMADRAFT_221260 [Galerina marginata CBS 339.88]|uniref:J domain-containing protein n=1 Tax=Galerina marginata (strain CBS 339.88) TaxID=685588 RepID=A0A067TNC2_GALM3|nr:hypothetical protein GALMADRAFT_221260 [Galerina marginata CBS 339.88]